MRIWHEQLIPKLCQKHLCAMWREGLGMYKIITENKSGYRNHPATKEFIGEPPKLITRLRKVREEMIKRGYHPKELPLMIPTGDTANDFIWQTFEQQIEVLKAKKEEKPEVCNCHV